MVQVPAARHKIEQRLQSNTQPRRAAKKIVWKHRALSPHRSRAQNHTPLPLALQPMKCVPTLKCCGCASNNVTPIRHRPTPLADPQPAHAPLPSPLRPSPLLSVQQPTDSPPSLPPTPTQPHTSLPAGSGLLHHGPRVDGPIATARELPAAVAHVLQLDAEGLCAAGVAAKVQDVARAQGRGSAVRQLPPVHPRAAVGPQVLDRVPGGGGVGVWGCGGRRRGPRGRGGVCLGEGGI